jgi:hypothetical protein
LCARDRVSKVQGRVATSDAIASERPSPRPYRNRAPHPRRPRTGNDEAQSAASAEISKPISLGTATNSGTDDRRAVSLLATPAALRYRPKLCCKITAYSWRAADHRQAHNPGVHAPILNAAR